MRRWKKRILNNNYILSIMVCQTLCWNLFEIISLNLPHKSIRSVLWLCVFCSWWNGGWRTERSSGLSKVPQPVSDRVNTSLFFSISRFTIHPSLPELVPVYILYPEVISNGVPLPSHKWTWQQLLHLKISQSWYYCFWGLENSLLWGAVLCIMGVWKHCWPLPARCQ